MGSKCLGEIVNAKLAIFREDYERKKSDTLFKAADIRHLLKQLGEQTMNAVLRSAKFVHDELKCTCLLLCLNN